MLAAKDYWVLLECGESDSAVIGKLPDNCPEDWELLQGDSIAVEFPAQVNLEFSKMDPNNIKLYDFVENILLLRIVSDRVKQVFDNLGIDQLEYIPVAIHDHQGSLVAENYYILNVMNMQPVIDLNKSKYDISSINEEKISFVSKLHVDTKTIDPESKLFRSDRMYSLYFITDEVLKAMQDANITGIRVIKAEGWNGQTLVL